MHHLEIARQLRRQRHLAPVPYAPLERAEPDGACVQVDVERPERQDLAHPGAGMGDREHERLIDRLPHVRGRPDEALALVERQVLAATIVDELHRRIHVPMLLTGKLRP